MDDDELLTRHTQFEKHLAYFMEQPAVDLISVLPFNLPFCTPLKKVAYNYFVQPMNDAPKPLKIPHMAMLNDKYIVVGKPANIFIARTDKIKEIGYDDNIRMIDHNEFFYRAAGNLVSAMDITSFVFHYHSPFDKHYDKYRSDVEGDREYIRKKHAFY